MSVSRNIIILIFILLVAPLLGKYIGQLYISFFPIDVGAGFFGFDLDTPLSIYVATYTSLVTLVFTAWGLGKKYWWMGVLLVPALAFVLYFDLARIWFYILVGLVGWAIGYGISKLPAK